MEETKDQVQVDTPATEQAPQEQSTSEQVVSESKLYKLPDGREVSADDLYKEHTEKLLPEFTRRSQELAEFKRQNQESEARNKKTAEESLSQNKLLENVDPSVRDAIVQIVSPVIQEALGQRDKAEQVKRDNEVFNNRLTDLEKKYGKKFDRVEILRKMQEPTNEIYDPEVLYQKLHWDEYIDGEIKAAMKGKSGGVSTESTSAEAPKKPGEQTPPTTWSEASRRAQSRI
jgi:predicted NAD-dependent protein-ADP-ribosyltransferase YbiA (DUF1768 family)